MADRTIPPTQGADTNTSLADHQIGELLPILPKNLSDSMWMDILNYAYADALRRTRSSQQAEEIAEAAIEKLLRVAEPIHPHAYPAYIRKTVRNLIIDASRRRGAAMRRGGEVLCDAETYQHLESVGQFQDGAADPEAQLIDLEAERERTQMCATLLATLPARQRQAIDLFVSGASHAAIAARLGMASPAVSKQTIYRILKNLRQRAESMAFVLP